LRHRVNQFWVSLSEVPRAAAAHAVSRYDNPLRFKAALKPRVALP